MGKLLALLLVALFVVTLAGACTPPGLPCLQSSDCCSDFLCNPWNGRCIKPKTLSTQSNGNGNGYGGYGGYGPQIPWRWPWARAANDDDAGWNWPGF